MNTHDFYRYTHEAKKHLDTVDVESITREDEVILAMALNKIGVIHHTLERLYEIATQFNGLYRVIIEQPEKFPILRQTESEDIAHEQLGEAPCTDDRTD